MQVDSSPVPLQEVYSSISKKYKKPSKDLQKIYSHAINRINQDLIVTFVRGNLNGFLGNAGILFAMPDRLLHYGDKNAKYEIIEFDYSRISHVNVKSGLTGYKLTFGYDGKENTVSTIDEGNIDDMVAFIREKIAEDSQQDIANIPISNSVSDNIPNQIRQFAELRDQGIITEEEFIKKKEQLLNM
ncbi:SHOCT domain-containing protein [Bacillus spizizenii]